MCGACRKHCHRQHRPGDERHSVPFKKQFSQQSLEGEKPLTSWGQGNKAIKMEPHRTHMGPIFEEKQRLPQRLGWGRSHTWVSARKQLSKVIRLQKSAWVCQPGRAGSLICPLCPAPCLLQIKDGTVKSSGYAPRAHSTRRNRPGCPPWRPSVPSVQTMVEPPDLCSPRPC